jgi:hypothetical protein
VKLKRGLFSIERKVVPLEETAELEAFFRNIKAPKQSVDDNIETIRAAAGQAILDANLPSQHSGELREDFQYPLEGNGALGYEVLMHLRLIEGARRDNRTDDAIRDAMLATEKWMQLRVNALFEKAVREKERRRATASVLTDDECTKALKAHTTVQAAADALGISARQLSNRVPKAVRDRIKLEKKSP